MLHQSKFRLGGASKVTQRAPPIKRPETCEKGARFSDAVYLYRTVTINISLWGRVLPAGWGTSVGAWTGRRWWRPRVWPRRWGGGSAWGTWDVRSGDNLEMAEFQEIALEKSFGWHFLKQSHKFLVKWRTGRELGKRLLKGHRFATWRYRHIILNYSDWKCHRGPRQAFITLMRAPNSAKRCWMCHFNDRSRCHAPIQKSDRFTARNTRLDYETRLEAKIFRITFYIFIIIFYVPRVVYDWEIIRY